MSKISTPSGIEATSFRLVVQCPDQLEGKEKYTE